MTNVVIPQENAEFPQSFTGRTSANRDKSPNILGTCIWLLYIPCDGNRFTKRALLGRCDLRLQVRRLRNESITAAAPPCQQYASSQQCLHGEPGIAVTSELRL